MSSPSSDSTQYAETNQQLEDPPEEDIELIDDAKPAARFLWPKMNKTKIIVNGETIPGYRFLQDTNKVDRIFVNVMHEIEPFLGKHGEKQDLWDQVAAECKKRSQTLFRDFDSRNAKFRLEAYQKFVSSFRTNDKKDTGCDNQQPPTDLLLLIENLVDKKNSFDSGRKEKKNQNDNKKKDKEVAASVRMAALGCHTKVAKKQPPPAAPTNSNETIDDDDFLNEGGDLILDDDDDDDDDQSYKEATEKARSNQIDLPPTKTINNNSIKRRQSFGDEYNTRVSNLEERVAETNKVFAESKKQKNELEERRMNMEAEANKQRFDLEQQRIDLEDRRLKIEESRAETDKVRAIADKEDRAMSREMMMSMLSMMKSMQENMNSKK
jgi:hypothetical protein